MTAKGSDLPFGIDFGGSGIKGAPVDLTSGEFAEDRVRIDTPRPSTPKAVAEVFAELLGRFEDSDGCVGVTVPAVVVHGVVHSAANIDKAWVGADRFFLTYGDILLRPPTDYALLSGAFREDGVIALKKVSEEELAKGGAVVLDANGLMAELIEKGAGKPPQPRTAQPVSRAARD